MARQRVAGTPAASDAPHVHRWQLGANVNGVTPGHCACGETRVFDDRPIGPPRKSTPIALNSHAAPTPRAKVKPVRKPFNSYRIGSI